MQPSLFEHRDRNGWLVTEAGELLCSGCGEPVRDPKPRIYRREDQTCWHRSCLVDAGLADRATVTIEEREREGRRSRRVRPAPS